MDNLIGFDFKKLMEEAVAFSENMLFGEGIPFTTFVAGRNDIAPGSVMTGSSGSMIRPRITKIEAMSKGQVWGTSQIFVRNSTSGFRQSLYSVLYERAARRHLANVPCSRPRRSSRGTHPAGNRMLRTFSG